MVVSRTRCAGRAARDDTVALGRGPGAGCPGAMTTSCEIDLIPIEQRYSVGDTATLLIASPFTNVEAWFTVERERVLESRRIALTPVQRRSRCRSRKRSRPTRSFPSCWCAAAVHRPARSTILVVRALRVGYAELRVVARGEAS